MAEVSWLAKKADESEVSVDVKELRRWILFVMFWIGTLVGGPAQSIDLPGAVAAAVDSPPVSGILDNAGFFQRNPVVHASIMNRIRQLREDHGFQIYLVVESVLVTGNVQAIAMELQRKWVPKSDGMVLVFEVDSRALGVSNGYEQNFEPEELVAGQVPSYETTAILTRVAAGLKRSDPPDVFMDRLIAGLADEYEGYFQRKESPVPEGRAVRLVLIIVGGLSALALIGLIAALLVRRADRKGDRKSFFFPETEAVERLGAPYGGGDVSSRRFGTGGR